MRLRASDRVWYAMAEQVCQHRASSRYADFPNPGYRQSIFVDLEEPHGDAVVVKIRFTILISYRLVAHRFAADIHGVASEILEYLRCGVLFERFTARTLHGARVTLKRG